MFTLLDINIQYINNVSLLSTYLLSFYITFFALFIFYMSLLLVILDYCLFILLSIIIFLQIFIISQLFIFTIKKILLISLKYLKHLLKIVIKTYQSFLVLKNLQALETSQKQSHCLFKPLEDFDNLKKSIESIRNLKTFSYVY